MPQPTPDDPDFLRREPGKPVRQFSFSPKIAAWRRRVAWMKKFPSLQTRATRKRAISPRRRKKERET